PEAFALHFADNMDAKVNQCRNTVPAQEVGAAWSPYQNLLGRSLCRPVRTPEPAPSEEKRKGRAEKKNDKQEERQCSLL
ncbi:MAG: DNA-binding protein, partial [Mailhella sp.]|nr:DNA-binding protein [Mailhella sp.]